MNGEPAPRRFLLGWAGAFALVFVALGIAPFNRGDWLLENLLVVALGFALAYGHRRLALPRSAVVLLFAYLCLHELGAHFTYSRVPYDAGWQALGGDSLKASFGWRRNHFDRLVHFAYGLLLAHPLRCILLRLTPLRGFWSYFFVLDFILASSAIYELIEWVGGEFFGGDESAAFVGAQDDAWDAQKDMALAALGGLLALLAIAWRQRRAVTAPGRDCAPSLAGEPRA
ncbi:DUF2238 domain-containing protein [Pseudomonas mangiferae]|uniref:DUF2238 domain-containing protein n=1 Tax=Pseudomonas mangiferae TaxID=2593654 RepID=A0A553GVW4_9PSED|nr:DUF2238 domain-containing protein [Pseudomonas mangiferae]TRX73658.1 DUF2238 domain-containing protein [Pseudomonas mangiferae]